MRFTIPGDPVTKKSSQRIVRLKNGRPFIRPSERFESYQKMAGMFIPASARKGISAPVNVKCVYFMETRRRVDLVNLLEATCDILVHYGALADDNSKIVVSHDGSRVRWDKENPRVEIEITEGSEI